MRIFAGIFPPPEVQEALSGIQYLLRADQSPVRWEEKEKFHFTLKFLGETGQQQTGALENALAKALQHNRPSIITISGIGCFPDEDSPRVIWAGTGSGSVIANHFKAVEQAAVESGFAPETRSFHSHITLGRCKGIVTSNLKKLIQNTTFEVLEFRCSEICLVQSTLLPLGSHYSTLFTIPLPQEVL